MPFMVKKTMTQQNDHQAEIDSADSNGKIHPRRRRLLTGSAAGAGIFLASQAKTALGTTTCQSPSAMISGNTSPRPGDGHVCSGGRSPGFWKQPLHFGYWGARTGDGLVVVSPPKFRVTIGSCSTGLRNVSPCDISDPGTLIETIFPGAIGGSKGIWEVLVWPTQYPKVAIGSTCTLTGEKIDAFGGQGQLLRHLACAYLNAGYFNSVSQDYPLTQLQVVAMWNAVKGGGIYCPNGMTCANGAGMSAQNIIDYIQNLYGINADVDGDLCKKN